MENERTISLDQIREMFEQLSDDQYRRYVIPAMLLFGCVLVVLFSVTCSNRAGGLSAGEMFANKLGSALYENPSVRSVKSVYVPEDGLYIYTLLTTEDRAATLAWIQQQFLPYEEVLAEQDRGDSLTWIFDYGPSGEIREALVAPLSRVGESTYHQYLQINALPPVLFDAPNFDPAMIAMNGNGMFGQPDLTSTAQAVAILGQPIGRQFPTLDWFEVYETGFDDSLISDWSPVSGEWASLNGDLIQSDIRQYDAAIQLASQPLTRYRLETTFVWQEGAFSTGLLLNAPFLGDVTDADYATITNNGTLIETGYFDRNGVNQFGASFPIEPGLDLGLPHTLRLDANAGENVLFIDGIERARFQTRRASGHVGLITSQARFGFSGLRVDNFESGFGAAEGFASVPESLPAADAGAQDVAAAPSQNNQTEETVIQPIPSQGESIQPILPAPVNPPASGANLIYTGGFDTGAAGWAPITGDWIVNNGVYEQSDAIGFDFITMFEMDPLAHYSMEGNIRLVDGQNGGGFIYNAPDPATRIGAHVVDFTENGQFLRWGYYNENAEYVFVDGVNLAPGLSDGEFHNLRLVTHETETQIFVDGVEVGQAVNQNSFGHLGLMSSQARVQFDDVSINQIPAETSAPLTGDFVDGFGTEFADGWRTISGEWRVVGGEYRQIELSGFDLATVSNYSGSNYIVRVRVRLIDGELGAGLLYNMQSRDSIAGSQMFNFTRFGETLQWGLFDNSGDFNFEGIVDVEDVDDGSWQQLELIVQDGFSTISLNGAVLKDEIPLAYDQGFIGLLVSTSSVAFDDFQVISLEEGSVGQTLTTEPVPFTRAFAFETEADLVDWQAFAGNWIFGNGSYIQNEADLFDLGTVANFQMVGPHTISTDTRYISGSMGGGLLFNMQDPTSKNRSMMVSYTSDGQFLQWGNFDESGVFNITGSQEVPSGQDGTWHTLSVVVNTTDFNIVLDGAPIAEGVPLVYQNGYPGLIANLGQVEFDNFTLDGQLRQPGTPSLEG